MMTLHYFEEVCVLHNPVAARPDDASDDKYIHTWGSNRSQSGAAPRAALSGRGSANGTPDLNRSAHYILDYSVRFGFSSNFLRQPRRLVFVVGDGITGDLGRTGSWSGR